jgi:Leucine-rich repeat (LRR) protein
MGGIPPTFGNCSHLSTLNLSTNLLMRPILNELGELRKLIVLDLSYNAFIGEIPYSIFNKLPLENLDVSYNNLFGVLPLSFLVVTNVKGNLDLCDVANNCEVNRQQTSNKSNGVMVSIVVGTFVAAIIVLIIGSCCFY